MGVCCSADLCVYPAPHGRKKIFDKLKTQTPLISTFGTLSTQKLKFQCEKNIHCCAFWLKRIRIEGGRIFARPLYKHAVTELNSALVAATSDAICVGLSTMLKNRRRQKAWSRRLERVSHRRHCISEIKDDARRRHLVDGTTPMHLTERWQKR